jgi:predicted MFS family arabinose efflux permease
VLPGRRGLRAIALAAGFTTFGPLPAFFLGALAVLVREDLLLSEARLGATIATFFAFAALASAPVGRISDRVGARRALHLGLMAVAVALATMAVATRWWQLPLALTVAGVGHATLQVASNRLLTDDVTPGIQGLAFGIKQSAIPTATMTAGATVPVIGTQLGWRWTYGVAAAVAVLVLLLQRRPGAAPRRRAAPRPAFDGDDGERFTGRELLLLASAVGLAAAAANTLPAFLVAFAVHAGTPVSQAGVLLAVASGAGLTARVLIGRLADVRGSTELAWVALLLVAGSLAFAAIPLTHAGPAVLWAAACVAFACGWGWPGYVTFIVVRKNARTPASASGVVQAGIFTGAVLGPLVFGVTVTSVSYTAAWRGAAVAQVLAAVLVLLIRSTRQMRLTTNHV